MGSPFPCVNSLFQNILASFIIFGRLYEALLSQVPQKKIICIIEFHGLDNEVLIRALRTLESSKKAEVIKFDENEGVKFF